MVSGFNANMLVFDSEFLETQVNYACYNNDSRTLKNIFRTGTSNNTFYWEYSSNVDLTTSKFISDSHLNYSQFASFTLSESSFAYGVSNNFDMTVNGSLYLNGSNATTIFSQNAVIGSINNNLILGYQNNVGIGTFSPMANIHLYNPFGSTIIENNSQGEDILRLLSQGGVQQITFNNSGYVGIGTIAPRAQLDVIGTIYTINGSTIAPSYSFSGNPDTGMYLPGNSTIGFVTNNVEAMRIDNNGNIAIGINDTTRAYVNINSASTVPLLNLTQTGIGNILQINNYNTNNLITIDYNGNVGIGTMTPSCNLDIYGSMHVSSNIYIDNGAYFASNVLINNNLQVNGLFTNPSDSNIKTNINRISGALDKISQISGYTFNMIHNNNKSTGLIAQEVNNILPEVVSKDENGIYGIAYGNMMGLIVESIKELKSEINSIKIKIGM
jgi:hypothetical protein